MQFISSTEEQIFTTTINLLLHVFTFVLFILQFRPHGKPMLVKIDSKLVS